MFRVFVAVLLAVVFATPSVQAQESACTGIIASRQYEANRLDILRALGENDSILQELRDAHTRPASAEWRAAFEAAIGARREILSQTQDNRPPAEWRDSHAKFVEAQSLWIDAMVEDLRSTNFSDRITSTRELPELERMTNETIRLIREASRTMQVAFALDPSPRPESEYEACRRELGT